MKKIFVSALLLTCSLSALGNSSYELIIDSMQDLEKHKPEILSIPEADRNTFIRYMMRKELRIKLNQGRLADGLTVREAIQNQQAFEKDRNSKMQQEKQKKETEKAEKEKAVTDFNQKFELSITGARKAKNALNQDILLVSLSLKITQISQLSLYNRIFNLYWVKINKLFHPCVQKNLKTAFRLMAQRFLSLGLI
ncbi:hypothetical protein DIBJMFBN_02907 [Mannheimia haemolytica]